MNGVALVVLLVSPESLAGASFQLSFAAVASIIALHSSAWARRLFQRRDEGIADFLERVQFHVGAETATADETFFRILDLEAADEVLARLSTEPDTDEFWSAPAPRDWSRPPERRASARRWRSSSGT